VLAQVLPVSEGFKLFKRIGRGQYGEVFLAEAPGGVNVAVKRVFRSLDDESSQRELQSLELIRELRHPFLLQTQAFWSLEDRLVIVMELADGSLAEWNREVRKAGAEGIPLEDLLRYFREAAEALDYLHSMNVLHRDVKPANLLRLKGHAKVADFGLARMMENQQASATFCGTPLYMAPEVWKKQVCAASDQYSLAAAYAEVRTGRPIFAGTDYVQICLQHASGKPDLAPLEEAEQRVLLKALAKDPERRYPSCKAFAEALQEALAPPPPVAPARRSRGLLVAALACGLLATAAVVWGVIRPAPTPTTPVAEPLLPPGCRPEKEDTEPGGQYYKRIVHPVAGGPPALFLLIPRSKSGAPPFYVMRDKVSLKQFKAAAADPAMQKLLDEASKLGPWAAPGEWKTKQDQAQDDLPVFYVTLPEARCFANFLGGDVPTATQWDKAGGRFDGNWKKEDQGGGPFQPDKPPKGFVIAQNKTREDNGEPLVPIPAGDERGDESFFGCRDMADNGREWTSTSSRGDLINLSGGLLETDEYKVRGASFMDFTVFRFEDKSQGGPRPLREKGRVDIGFRVVIEAPRESQ
jgi:hypothetical protein